MTLYDDPNRETVGLAPIWTGAEETAPPPDPEPEPEPEAKPADVGFDPGEHTVAEVEEYVGANPDQAAVVLAAESAGKARSTLLDWLESQGG